MNYVYACKADNFEFLNKYDSLRIYFQRAYKLNPDPITAANIANYFIVHKKNEMDSAKYYLEAASDKLETKAYGLFQKLIVLKAYGDFYSGKKEYDKALGYYLQSLSIADKMDKKDEKKSLYKLLSISYKAQKDDKESTKYLHKYTSLNDSLNALDKKALSISVEKLMLDKELEKESEIRKTSSLFILASCIILVLIVWIYTHYIRKKIEKECLIQIQQGVIVQSQEEKRKLEHKVNNALDEILQLAKKNDPTFLARFKDLYPEFCERLLNRYPNILSSELTFCAYLKLNLSTRDIAGYTFVTEKTVQSRKSRLRKRMGIPSNEDLYIWISKI